MYKSLGGIPFHRHFPEWDMRILPATDEARASITSVHYITINLISSTVFCSYMKFFLKIVEFGRYQIAKTCLMYPSARGKVLSSPVP